MSSPSACSSTRRKWWTFRRRLAATRKLYGLDQKITEEFGLRCLLARRMVERGVRFVQLYCGDTNGWDGHSDMEGNHSKLCAQSDLPVAGLLKDLKSRGLLDSTLVIWGGEFGRMPMSEGSNGRDHNPHGFSMFLAGGGVKGGQVIGATDAVGLRAESDKAHVHDIHATILHLLGLDHTRLTFRHNGRNERLDRRQRRSDTPGVRVKRGSRLELRRATTCISPGVSARIRTNRAEPSCLKCCAGYGAIIRAPMTRATPATGRSSFRRLRRRRSRASPK